MRVQKDVRTLVYALPWPRFQMRGGGGGGDVKRGRKRKARIKTKRPHTHAKIFVGELGGSSIALFLWLATRALFLAPFLTHDPADS